MTDGDRPQSLNPFKSKAIKSGVLDLFPTLILGIHSPNWWNWLFPTPGVQRLAVEKETNFEGQAAPPAR